MKAFLSHSSIDKEFVREVANKLGRLSCIFDERSFSSGDNFKEAIEEHMEKTAVFIFFATKSSLESFWCDFEIDQAFYMKLKAKLSSAVVYIIDESVDFSLVPDWLKNTLIKHETSPAVIARDIVHHLNKSTEEYQRPVFLGRTSERENLEEALNPIDGSLSPSVISLFGLPGVGRRSLLKSTIKDLYSLAKYVEIELEAGDDVYSLCAKLADIIEPYSCQDELKDIVNEINELEESKVIKRIVRNISNIVSSGELPVIVDAGGLLEDNGCIKEYLNEVILRVNDEVDTYILLVLTRRISHENSIKIDSVSIEQLSDKATSQLLSKLSQRAELVIEADSIRELTDYINGYPPAAIFAVKQAQIYSVDALVNDKRKLTQFSQKRFINHIQDHDLNKSDIIALQVLSGYSPLSLNALLALYSESDSEAHDRIYELIDCSLVRVQDGQLYKIADPIKGSVNEVFGYAKNDDLRKVIDPLKMYISSTEETKKLELSRVLYRLGFVLNDRTASQQGINFKADYIKLLESAYHQRRYKDAVKLGFETIEHCGDSAKARTFLIKALIQDEKWDSAQKQIDDLYPTDSYKNVYYLQGFLERKRGEFQKAIDAFSKSEAHHRKGFALYREFSHCYLMSGDLTSASKYIDKALDKQPNNNQVIDMAAKISIRNGNELVAKKNIDKLELLDSPEHFNLRLSAFHMAFNRNPESLEAARLSVKNGGPRFFSGRVQLIKILTRTGNVLEAEKEMSALNSDFSRTKNDVRVSLSCSIAIEKNDYKTAFDLSDRFLNKSSDQYKGIRKTCMLSLSKNVTIPYEERKKYKSELNALNGIEELSLDNVDS